MAARRDRWVIVSGAGGALGGALAAYYAGRGRPVLALDQRFDTDLASAEGISARTINVLVEADVRQALADAIDAKFAAWRKDGTLQGLADKWFGASIDWSKAE